jgi:hypothetical protein
MVCHLYNLDELREECRKAAARLHVTVEFPVDFPSWHYPGHTSLVVYVLPQPWAEASEIRLYRRSLRYRQR